MNHFSLFLRIALISSLSPLLELQAGTVTNSADSGLGSLRDAISAAVNGETIVFDPSLNEATILLTTGGLVISSRQITIDASALPGGISVSGNHTFRVLQINGGSNVTLKKIVLCDGRAAESSGGGLALVGSHVQMSDCVIKNCFATNSGGGVLLSFGTTAVFERCKFTGNSASPLSFGGGINVSGAASSLFRSCVIAGNSSPFGGGLAISNSSPQLINCTVQGNKGSGIRNDSNSDTVLGNTIVWGNTVSSPGTIASQQVENSSNSNPNISHCLIQGASGSGSFSDGNATIWGAGNLDGILATNDPKFVEETLASSAPHAGGKLLLLATSPALNVGSNSLDIGTLDLNGKPRVKDTTVELGAYEGGFVTFALLHPFLDPAGDANVNSITNCQEYASGFDPSAPDHPGLRPSFSISGGSKFLTSSLRSDAADLSAFWQTSTSLGMGTWTTMIQGVNFNVETVTDTTPSRQQWVLKLLDGDNRRFYRQGFLED